MDEINRTGQREGYPTVFAGSMLYLVTLSLMLTASSLFGGRGHEGTTYYLLMFVMQFVIIALPPLLYMLFKGIRIKETIRLHTVSLPEILLVAGMAFFGYLVIIALNLIWYWVLSHFGTPEPQALPTIETGTQYAMAILVIAVVPAVFEELLFRGVIQRGYERLGLTFSIVMTGILFALLHLSILSLPAIIILGIMLCYIVYRSNSIWTGVIYHFINNSIAVTITYLQGLLSDLFPMEGAAESAAELPTETMMAGMLFWGVIGIFALGIFGACFAGFHAVTRNREKTFIQEADTRVKSSRAELIPAVAAVALALLLLVWEVSRLVSGV